MERKGGFRYIIVLLLGLISSFSIYGGSVKLVSPWSKMAQGDLLTTKKLILNNSPKAKYNNYYTDWLNVGYEKALAKAKNIYSYPGYISVMYYYLSGFRDYHTEAIPLLKITNHSEKWPGFIVAQRNKSVVVIYHSKDTHQWNNLPEVGAKLISCDGKSTRQLIRTNIIPFNVAHKEYPSTWSQYIPTLFVWQENPFIHYPKKCTFVFHGRKYIDKLKWTVVGKASPLSLGFFDFSQKIAEAAFGSVPPFNISKFSKDGIWISIPIFAWGLPTQGTTTTKLLEKIAKKIKQYRNSDLLVFDLRGNTGGDPKYMRPIIMNLYGAKYLSSLGKHFIWNQQEKTEFSATDVTLQNMLKSNSPKDMISGMKMAIKASKKKFIYTKNILKSKVLGADNPVKAKVILLTDGRCGSECANFVMIMESIPGVIQVGQPTASGANSTWNVVKVFSDKASAIIYPTGLVLSPKIDDGKPFFPKYYYKGFMGNTPALKKWIEKLYKSKRLGKQYG